MMMVCIGGPWHCEVIPVTEQLTHVEIITNKLLDRVKAYSPREIINIQDLEYIRHRYKHERVNVGGSGIVLSGEYLRWEQMDKTTSLKADIGLILASALKLAERR